MLGEWGFVLGRGGVGRFGGSFWGCISAGIGGVKGAVLGVWVVLSAGIGGLFHRSCCLGRCFEYSYELC